MSDLLALYSQNTEDIRFIKLDLQLIDVVIVTHDAIELTDSLN